MYSCIHRYYPAFILIVLELFPFPFFPSHGVCLYCACAGLLLAAQCFRRTTVLFRRARPRGMHKCWNGEEEEEEEEEEEAEEAKGEADQTGALEVGSGRFVRRQPQPKQQTTNEGRKEGIDSSTIHSLNHSISQSAR